MTRPHCMFIQNQNLPWMTGVLPGSRQDLPTRLLSRDESTGALTAIVQYPAGWQSGTHWLDTQEECLVLDGQLCMNGKDYGPISYMCLPKGMPRDGAKSKAGATALVMLACETSEHTGNATDTSFDQTRLVEKIDPVARGLETWTENPYTRYLMGTGVTPLREDPDTGEISMLYAALPFRFMAKRWSHPVVQEMFVLGGEYAINDVGLMCPGAYAWWAPNEWHGPYGSLRGFMMFIRSHGGPLSNLIDDQIVDVDYAPPYKPILPEALKPYGQTPNGSPLF